MPTNIAIQTFNLTKKFKELAAVNGINLEIKKNELFSLLGPNGAGKSTTINMLCCLLKPTYGTATVLGYDILKEANKVKELIGVCPQETVISEMLNCWENLKLIGGLHGLSNIEIKEKSKRILKTLGLLERSKEKVVKFSGGMKRRLSLAMALINEPEILFLDEPTLGLDPQARRAMWEYIEELKKTKTILLTTHYMEEAEALSDRVAIIDNGKIVALGTTKELKKSILEKAALVLEVKNFSSSVIPALEAKYESVYYNNGKLTLESKKLDLSQIISELNYHNVVVSSALPKEPSLEEVFIKLTGKELRD